MHSALVSLLVFCYLPFQFYKLPALFMSCSAHGGGSIRVEWVYIYPKVVSLPPPSSRRKVKQNGGHEDDNVFVVLVDMDDGNNENMKKSRFCRVYLAHLLGNFLGHIFEQLSPFLSSSCGPRNPVPYSSCLRGGD